MSVNVSTRQLMSAGFADTVADVLDPHRPTRAVDT